VEGGSWGVLGFFTPWYRDLYVVDGAAIPSSVAVNPQITIMSLATRAAEKLAARLLD
jgi:choline dehydrogenase-like flavoprotein